MSDEYTPIPALDDSRTDWVILLKISRLWLATRPGASPNDASLECVGIDSYGNQIHIEIDRDLVPVYVDILQEAKTYVMSHFLVVPSTSFELVTRNVKIEFTVGTTAVEYMGEPKQIPNHVFEFCDYNDIPDHEGDDEFLIDLIGILHAIRDAEITPTKYGLTPRTNIVLRNTVGDIANVTLWGTKSDEIANMGLRGCAHTIILIVTSLVVKRIAGVHRASSTSATKVYANLEHAEVIQHLHSCGGHNQPPLLLPFEQNTRIRTNWTDDDTILSVAQLLNLPRNNLRDRRFRTIAQVDDFNLSNFWYYDGCKLCLRKMPHAIKTTCNNCGARDIYAEPCYKLEVQMKDSTATALFMFFGNAAEQFVGMPIASLLLRERTTRRRLPPRVANLKQTRWELQVTVNPKSYMVMNLVFNVNKVVRQLISELPALPAIEPAHPTFMPQQLQLPCHLLTPQHYTQQHGEEHASSTSKGKRPMTTEELEEDRKKATVRKPVQRQLFLQPSTVQVKAPMLQDSDIKECDTYFVQSPLSLSNIQEQQAIYESFLPTVYPKLQQLGSGSPLVYTSRKSVIKINAKENIVVAHQAVQDATLLPTSEVNKEESIGETKDTINDQQEVTEKEKEVTKAEKEELDKEIWKDLTDAGYTDEELKDINFYDKEVTDNKLECQTPTTGIVDASPETSSP